LHGRRAADQLADRQLLTQPHAEGLHLATEEAPLHEPLHQVAELVEDQWFGEVIVGAFLERLDRRGDRRIAGHDHHFHRLIPLLELTEQVDAAHVRHSHVGEGRVEHLRTQGGERVGGAVRGSDLIAPLGQGFLE
jgi:hypothetical protein